MTAIRIQPEVSIPLTLNPPTATNIRYSQDIRIYHIMGVFDIRSSGGVDIRGREVIRTAQA